MSKILNKILRNAITNNEYIIGSREVYKKIDKVRLIIAANTLDTKIRSKYESLCKDRDIIFYSINNTSRELGKLCNKPFKVSLIALREIDNNDLTELVKEININ